MLRSHQSASWAVIIPWRSGGGGGGGGGGGRQRGCFIFQEGWRRSCAVALCGGKGEINKQTRGVGGGRRGGGGGGGGVQAESSGASPPLSRSIPQKYTDTVHTHTHSSTLHPRPKKRGGENTRTQHTTTCLSFVSTRLRLLQLPAPRSELI